MDVLAGLLDGPRARGAFLLRMIMEPPWSVRIEDGAPICLMCVTEGEAWVIPDTGAPVLLRPGDIAIARPPEPYTIADTPDAPPRAVIGPDGNCTTLSGEPLAETMRLGVRTWATPTAARRSSSAPTGWTARSAAGSSTPCRGCCTCLPRNGTAPSHPSSARR
ncbi:hypothetical protein SNARM312S_06998 [Streptomyces narbonensis]